MRKEFFHNTEEFSDETGENADHTPNTTDCVVELLNEYLRQQPNLRDVVVLPESDVDAEISAMLEDLKHRDAMKTNRFWREWLATIERAMERNETGEYVRPNHAKNAKAQIISLHQAFEMQDSGACDIRQWVKEKEQSGKAERDPKKRQSLVKSVALVMGIFSGVDAAYISGQKSVIAQEGPKENATQEDKKYWMSFAEMDPIIAFEQFSSFANEPWAPEIVGLIFEHENMIDVEIISALPALMRYPHICSDDRVRNGISKAIKKYAEIYPVRFLDLVKQNFLAEDGFLRALIDKETLVRHILNGLEMMFEHQNNSYYYLSNIERFVQEYEPVIGHAPLAKAAKRAFYTFNSYGSIQLNLRLFLDHLPAFQNLFDQDETLQEVAVVLIGQAMQTDIVGLGMIFNSKVIIDRVIPPAELTQRLHTFGFTQDIRDIFARTAQSNSFFLTRHFEVAKEWFGENFMADTTCEAIKKNSAGVFMSDMDHRASVFLVGAETKTTLLLKLLAQ